MNNEDWKLIDRYLSGEINEVELARLQERLRTDAGLRADFRSAASLDMALSDMAGIDAAGSDLLMLDYAPKTTPKQSVSNRWWQGIAAALVIFMAGLLWWNFSEGVDPSYVSVNPPAASVEVASILRMENCVFKDNALTFEEGGRLSLGDIVLESGTIVFGLDKGARIVLEGPAHLSLETADKAFLHYGYLGFENFFIGETFEVRTPYSVLVDVGTEYSIEVGSVGEAIRVYDGEVWRTNPESADDISFIAKGETAVFGGQPELAFLGTGNRSKVLDYLPSEVSRTPWARDNFDYAVELNQPVELGEGGLGWDTPWRGLARTLSMEVLRRDALVLAEGFGFGDFFSATGKSAVISGNSTLHRRLAHPIRRDQSGTYYFSVLYKADTATQDGDTSTLFVNFRNTDNPSKNDSDRLTTGIFKGHTLLCRYGSSGRISAKTNPNEANLLVGKILIRPHAQDQINLDVIGDPEQLQEEPIWRLRAEGDTSKDPLDSIILHVIGDIPLHVSEIRFGKSWESVTR
ncbi:hypothetical protein QEH52_10450 [Coraliomargarita sp. SDUM461003]|uniref:FecR protein domain-containing protein n=1 Tax=Thalassobacterium maritimum TaxID=3041265 RepID=A0ABU1AV04_9BACT|nr:hypothetical protein [Coraliomargarita sp. SDUM461003]MDQ8207933.1 hypothetical protein [Coraliomargarita sp. SDUM461003]